MSRVCPIILWNPPRSRTSDEAGIGIIKSVLPPPYIPGPYPSSPPQISFHYVPSLSYFCIHTLYKFPDQVHAIGNIRLPYQPPTSPLSYDILRALIPSYSHPGADLDFSGVDPRLWATLVQIYDNLPEVFHTYRIPLSDEHLPLLQRIPSTSQFSLITILELPGCRDLSDDTITNLKGLDSLCAFDATGTRLTAYGIKVLAGTVLWSDHDGEPGGGKRTRRGPWGLRILRLRNCSKIDNKVFDCLTKFILLSVIDLRGTRCTPNTLAFRPATNTALYHPSPISTSLSALSSITTKLFSSKNPYILHIPVLRHHPPSPLPSSVPIKHKHKYKPCVAPQNGYVVFPPSEGSCSVVKTEFKRAPNGRKGARMKVGNTDTLDLERERKEAREKHEVNKEAWYKGYRRDAVDYWETHEDGEPYPYQCCSTCWDWCDYPAYDGWGDFERGRGCGCECHGGEEDNETDEEEEEESETEVEDETEEEEEQNTLVHDIPGLDPPTSNRPQSLTPPSPGLSQTTPQVPNDTSSTSLTIDERSPFGSMFNPHSGGALRSTLFDGHKQSSSSASSASGGVQRSPSPRLQEPHTRPSTSNPLGMESKIIRSITSTPADPSPPLDTPGGVSLQPPPAPTRSPPYNPGFMNDIPVRSVSGGQDDPQTADAGLYPNIHCAQVSHPQPETGTAQPQVIRQDPQTAATRSSRGGRGISAVIAEQARNRPHSNDPLVMNNLPVGSVSTSRGQEPQTADPGLYPNTLRTRASHPQSQAGIATTGGEGRLIKDSRISARRPSRGGPGMSSWAGEPTPETGCVVSGPGITGTNDAGQRLSLAGLPRPAINPTRIGDGSNTTEGIARPIARPQQSLDGLPQRLSSRASHQPPSLIQLPTLPSLTPPSPAHSPSPTPSSPPELEFQNLVAGREALAHDSLQTAISFYLPHSSTAPGPSSSTNEYSADVCRDREPERPPGRYDDLLMLFREPPPWSDLENTAPGDTRRMEVRPRALGIAVVDTTGPKAREAKRLADQASQKRRKVGSARPRVQTMPVAESRNPFRRQSVAEGASKPLHSRALLALPGPVETASVRNCVKPFRPISSLKAPSLPSELRTPSSNKSGVTAKSAPVFGSNVKPTTDSSSGCAPPTSQAKLKPNFASAKPDTGNMKGPLPNLLKRTAHSEAERPRKRLSIKASDSLPSSKDGNGIKSTESFDWSRWAKAV